MDGTEEFVAPVSWGCEMLGWWCPAHHGLGPVGERGHGEVCQHGNLRCSFLGGWRCRAGAGSAFRKGGGCSRRSGFCRTEQSGAHAPCLQSVAALLGSKFCQPSIRALA